MKQILATGRFRALLIVLPLGFIFLSTACSRLPRTYTSDAATAETRTSGTKPARINLNTATAAELERLPGVGPVLAGRIITYRNEYGRFRRAEHLMMVRGISDRKFRELQSLVRVE
ncbi:MAG: ComEA family DNA-binding protein [Pyrinomonadaceae bacterium]